MKDFPTKVVVSTVAALIALVVAPTSVGALDKPATTTPSNTAATEKRFAREAAAVQEPPGAVRCSSIGIAPTAPNATSGQRARALLDAVPNSARSRLMADAFVGFPSQPAVRVDVLAAESGELATPVVEAPGLAHATLPGTDVVISAHESAVQILGSTNRLGGVVSLAVRHALSCPGAVRLAIKVFEEGVAIDAMTADGGRQAIAWVGQAWAVDATGRELKTWYEADGDILRQLVDTRGATAPVTFDPTYNFLNCWGGHYSNLTAWHYLDLPSNDPEWCPVIGMFQARNGYRPVQGFETNVANVYGKVTVREAGNCSFPATNTGPFWDFKLPCQAHDYCYDLRKAGFTGTVSDPDCDNAFGDLMAAHCSYRILVNECMAVAVTYWQGVGLPGVVTNSDPAGVELQASHDALCLDVEASSQDDNARVLQWPCNRTSNQLFKLTPAPGDPGLFLVKPTHSNKCVDTYLPGLVQYACGWSEQVVDVRGAFNLDIYTIRPKWTGYETCYDVPYSSPTWGEQVTTYQCYETDNQLWFIW
jgi:hypothetical protein